MISFIQQHQANDVYRLVWLVWYRLNCWKWLEVWFLFSRMKWLVIFLVFSLIVFMAEPGECRKLDRRVKKFRKWLYKNKGKSMYSGLHIWFAFNTFVWNMTTYNIYAVDCNLTYKFAEFCVFTKSILGSI